MMKSKTRHDIWNWLIVPIIFILLAPFYYTNRLLSILFECMLRRIIKLKIKFVYKRS